MSRVQAYAALFGESDRRTPGSDELSRRIARLCTAGPGAKVLVLQSGPGRTARVLAREYGCNVTCLDEDTAALALLTQRAAGDGVAARITTQVGTFQSVKLDEATYDAVVAEGLTWNLAEAAAALRPVLAPGGRFASTTPCRVGLNTPQGVVDFWSERLGYSLSYPAAQLQAVERAGYEPLACESLPDSVWDDHYKVVDAGLARLSGPEGEALKTELKREIDVFRREGGRQSMTYALVIARRKEPNEKPPPARTR